MQFQMYPYVTVSPAKTLTSTTVESDRLQHDSHAAYVIAQQYSSAILSSLCFHYHKEEYSGHFENVS
jgi:hypothetical protein